MSENAIDSENISKPAPNTEKDKSRRQSGQEGQGQTRQEVGLFNPKADRANKKAEVIAMMKRAKGVTLAEVMKATCQAHTVRGFVSILAAREER